MSNHDIKLPPLPGDQGLQDPFIRRSLQAYGHAAIKADRQQRGEPVAFSYELATTRSGDGEYTNWSPRLSYSMPNVPDGSIRNLKWLYASPQPADPAVKNSLTAPEGWQLVPKEPTAYMMFMGVACWNLHDDSRDDVQEIYRGMLEAAPKFGEEE